MDQNYTWPCPVCAEHISWDNDACPSCNAIILEQDRDKHIQSAWDATGGSIESDNNRIRFYCPSCRKKLSVPNHYSGKKGKCSFCNLAVTIPSIAVQKVSHPDASTSVVESVIPNYQPLVCLYCNRIIDSALYFGPAGEPLCMQCGKNGRPRPVTKQDWNYGFQCQPVSNPLSDRETPLENSVPSPSLGNIEKQQCYKCYLMRVPKRITDRGPICLDCAGELEEELKSKVFHSSHSGSESQQITVAVPRPIYWPCPKCKSKIPGHSDDCPFCHAVITENDRELYRKQPRCERCNNACTLGQEVCKICGQEMNIKNKTREITPVPSTTSPDQFLVGCLGYFGFMFAWQLALSLGGFVLIGVLIALMYGIGAAAQIHPCIGWLAIGIIVWILIGSGGGSSGGTSATEGGVSTSNMNG